MDKTKKQKLTEIYRSLAPESFKMHHYDLAEITNIKDPVVWKEFLMEPDIQQWKQEELSVINDAELQKLLTDINESNSVGKAQIINALQKVLDGKKEDKKGPAFIYCYIPPNEQQEKAENVIKINGDPFLQ